jgi:hypothetical protein
VERARRSLTVLAALALVAVVWPTQPAQASADYRDPVEITFPLSSYDRYIDDFAFCRGGAGCPRRHRATDIMAPHGVQVHAAMGGRITYIPGLDGNPGSSGYMIFVAGDDGRTYAYIHLGRNGRPPSEAYAPGMARNVRVERGQLIGYVGSSGNASESAPHLHFEIRDDRVSDPYRAGDQNRINPYQSLLDAEARGDVACRTAPGTFLDVCGGSAHRSNVEAVAARGITLGCAAAGPRFCPWRVVDRGQMAAFLTRALDLPPGDGRRFADVPGSTWYAEDIDRLASAGITVGCDDAGERFCPNEPVSRAQMATFLTRAFDLPAASTPIGFTDVTDASPHREAIDAIAAEGITLGCGSSPLRYCPSDPIRRDQMASFLARATP